jgi:hypothetical protein
MLFISSDVHFIISVSSRQKSNIDLSFREPVVLLRFTPAVLGISGVNLVSPFGLVGLTSINFNILLGSFGFFER